MTNKFRNDLIEFIAGPGLELFKERMAGQFRMDAPSNSGESKAKIMATHEGVMLPAALWYTDKGRTKVDPSGVQPPSDTQGTGFINQVLDNDLDIWIEIISEWSQHRNDVVSAKST